MLHAIMLLDESGSMGPVKEDVIGGYKEYVKTLRKEKEGEVRLSLFTFDLAGYGLQDKPEVLHEKFVANNLDEAPSKINYNPRGSTPLNDAVLACIKRMKKVVGKDDDVVMIIYTDGYENSSVATGEEVKGKIARKEKQGWDFVYLGANQDAWSAGMNIGVSGLKLNTSETRVGTQAMYASAANMTNTARRASNRGQMSTGEGGTLAKAYDGKDIGETPVEEDEDGTP